MSKKTDLRASSKSKEHARQKKQKKTNRAKRQDARRRQNRRSHTRNAKELRSAIEWVVGDSQAMPEKVHGNTGWQTTCLLVQAMLWIFSDKANLTDAFDSGTRQCKKVCGQVAFTSFTGMAKALVRWSPWLSNILLKRIHHLIAMTAGKHWKTAGWVVMAVDGSRETTPRTASNEKAFCAPDYGKGQTALYRSKKTKGMRREANEKNPPAPPAPQIWITLVWHVATRLSWCWKLGPGNSSERAHMQGMLKDHKFPAKTLFAGDAGFVGYDFWKSITDARYEFVVRVGGNVTLLENLGYEVEPQDHNIVYCWPKTKRQASTPPLKLRMIKVKLGRKQAVLLTSVLDSQQLSDQDALTIYKSRWGIELEFRNLKQTYQRRKLRSRQSNRALVELDWSIMSALVVKLYALKQHLAKKRRRNDPPAAPERISFAGVVRAFRRILENLSDTDPEQRTLAEMLELALTDEYKRKSSKEARYKPKTKDIPSCGLPKVTCAPNAVRARLQKLGLGTAA